jgi:hypothetical protein
MRILGLCLVVSFMGTAAFAQSAQRVAAIAFSRDPARFLNQRIRVDGLGCWSVDAAYRCTTYKGLYVIPGEIAPAATKKAIGDECGGIVEDEEDPGCLFDLVFTPLAVTKGEGRLSQGDRSVTGQVWMVQTDSLTAVPRR